MFIRAENIPTSTIVTDICIVGSGPAGLSLASELIGTSKSVCVLESGTMEGASLTHDPDYDFESSGLAIEHASRRRAFGGTTSIWSGRWKFLDHIDFENRPWIPHSGWPITHSDIEPYYHRFAPHLHVPPLHHGIKPKNPFGDPFEASVFLMQKKEWQDWGASSRPVFDHAANVSVYLGIHASRFEKSGGAVTRLTCSAADGGSFVIEARKFVLACGGIENPRQLLLSEIGNEHDQVGRYYMDHPKRGCGVISLHKQIDMSQYWDESSEIPHGIGFRLADDVQRTESILNSHIFLKPSYEYTLAARIRRKFFGAGPLTRLSVRNYLEQAPVSSNRVVLSESLDTFGLRKASVEWQLSEMDKKTMRIFHRYLKDAVEKSGFGTLESPLLDANAPFPDFEDASHHMGTTRMGDDPQTSVVDRNCKVHGTDNLYIAGSSVFPTSGHANPTATICALAIRLADHLKSLS